MIAVVIHVQKQEDNYGSCVKRQYSIHFPLYPTQKSYHHTYEVTSPPQGPKCKYIPIHKD